MEDIAADTGLKKASLYYYFPTKEELFQAVVERKHQDFADRVEQILSGSNTAAEKLESYVSARFDYFKKLQSLNMVDFRSIARNMTLLRGMFRRYARKELDWLCQVFELGNENGEFELQSIEKTGQAFLHIMQGLRLRFMRAHSDQAPNPAAFAQHRREIMFVTQIFLRGIRAEIRENKRMPISKSKLKS